MSKFFDFLKNLDLKSILTINIFLALLITLPLTVFLSQKQTKTTGKAYLPPPTISFLKPSPTPTIPPITPAGPSEIIEISPFYGKVGDAAIIFGRNFGNQKKPIFFNNTLATQIQTWEDEKIVVLVPEGATSGLIMIDNISSPFPFIVFNESTTCELLFTASSSEKIIGQKNCPFFSKAKLILKPPAEVSPNSLSSLIFPNSPAPPKITERENFLEIGISFPGESFQEKLLLIKLSSDKKIKLISAQLYKEEELVPFFINPLNLIQ